MTTPGFRAPVSTYRVQLHAHFTFADLRQIAAYLATLGVTECYCSPPFTARAGSTHGYDITNHNELNPELGGWAGFDQMAAALAHQGLGLIVDFVPNHMGNDASTNGWWRDVLENGPSSPFARVFDIDWDPVKPELKNRLLLPLLGEPYGEALEQGLLQLGFEDGALVLHYKSLRLPINPRRGAPVFEWHLDALVAALGRDHRQLREFLSILTALRNLPPYTVTEEHLVAERTREKEVARERLARLATESEPIRRHIHEAISAVNGTPGNPASVEALHELLEQQVYRLAHWRTAADEINYRRFFDVNDLAGLRTEDAGVFDHIHELVLQLVADGKVTGLRLDHVDGLADPAAYLERLSAAVRQACGRHAEAPADEPPFYVVVEKILTGDEQLPREWATAGTTGYNFLNEVNGVFIDTRQRRRVMRTFEWLSGFTEPLADVLYDSRRVIIGTALASELQVLANAVNRLSERHPRWRDFTLGSLRRALREVVACFPVYRTYVTGAGAGKADRAYVRAALTAAQDRNPAMEPSIFDFLGRVLLLETSHGTGTRDDERAAAQRVEIARKFQQYTAPVQAKGVEDTAFYRYNALLSLNEVGGDPDHFGRTVDEFHAANRHRRTCWPREMLATATHDTKRGEDARARLNVLTELPVEWREAVTTWMRVTRTSRTTVNRQPAPDRNDEYHYYQALLAVWPPEHEGGAVPREAPAAIAERLRAYMIKAIREAKRHTSWINPNATYEDAVTRFVNETLQGRNAAAFLASFVPFARRISRLGALNSLAQLVLKVASPGVPDFYQGTELWDLTLVDPDNRRPVDYGRRREWLASLDPLLARAAGTESDRAHGDVRALIQEWPDGRIKLFITAAALRLRRADAALFLEGSYQPLVADGLHDERLVAFGRELANRVAIAFVPRLTATLGTAHAGLGPTSHDWADTRVRLPDEWMRRRWRHAFTGELMTPVRGGHGEWLLAGQVLATCPVALLVSAPE